MTAIEHRPQNMALAAVTFDREQLDLIKTQRVGKPVRARVDVPADLLRTLYINQQLSTIEIAALLGVSKRTVRTRLLEHNIPIRSLRAAFAVSTTHQTNAPRTGEASSSWKGGRKMHTGYWMVMQKGHPEANADGYVLEHRLIAEQTLGRRLGTGEEVHHINEIRTDNRPENLQVMTKSAHMSLHMTARHAQRRAARAAK